MSYSVFTGGTVKIIQNPQGKMEEAAKNMADALR
jgi:adenylate kinase